MLTLLVLRKLVCILTIQMQLQILVKLSGKHIQELITLSVQCVRLWKIARIMRTMMD